ncbi:MAG: response regulator transcription factor [Dehalococcoidia bacterium]
MGKTRILLVDDHAVFRQSLKGVLESLARCYTEVVGEAEDGETALVMARELRPEVVIMDIGLPGMDGIEATRVLKREKAQARVVILTVRDEQAYREAAREAGAVAYVTKEKVVPDLLGVVRGLVGQEAP